jgi:hypothetical protein
MPEEPIVEDKPQEAPPAAAPQSAIPIADLSGALVDAYRQITASQPQQQQQIQDPIDRLSQSEREALALEFSMDPVAAAKKVSDMGAQAERQRNYQAVLPMIQNQANTIVELYKSKKQRQDPYFAKIEPLFDKLMIGVNITPLVNMNEATRNNELDMRWKMARADVLEGEMKRQKTEPTLLSPGGQPGPGASKFEEDPWIANMAATYGFTKEQVAELESLNG